MDWNYVNYLVKPHIENPSNKVVNVNLTEDEEGIITVVIRIAPKVENVPPQRTPYAEGGVY